MKTRGYGALLAFTFCLISALSVLYWSNIKGQLTVSGGASGSSELPIKCVQTDRPQIALTFDTASGNEDTARILEILRSNDVTATFCDRRLGRRLPGRYKSNSRQQVMIWEITAPRILI